MILLKNKDKKANIKIGNNIEIKDGNDFPFDLTLYGRSTQATRSGKNLFNIPKVWSFTANKDLPFSLPAGAYHFTTGKVTKGGTDDPVLVLGNFPIFLVSNMDKIVTFENDITTYGYYSNGWNYANSKDITSTVEDLMISLNGGEYESYGVMPSPDYPSPIESITEISATVTGKNLISTTIFNANNYISQLLHLKVGNYTIKYTGDISSAICVRKNDGTTPINGTVVIEKYNLNTMTFSISEEGLYYIQFYKSGTGFANFENAQLEEGTVATSYEEYKSNSLTINLQGNELCSLPNGTKDEVNITNSKSSIVKRTKEFILDENKTIVLEKALTNTTRFLIYNVTSSMNDYPSAISTHFKYLVDYNSDTEHFYITRNGAIYLFVNKSIASTVDELKTWLSKNNVKFLHELAEPETINLGTVEMLSTYDGVSNITNSADTEMVVKYYKKFEFDKILRSGYNIDEQEYEIAKKQMANGKRKKILSSYVDCIIKIDLGLLDNKTYQEYKEQLEDGEYEYWSYKYNQYKKANFILTKPSITTEYAYDDEIGIDDMEITLEKSSDVS